MRMPLRNRVAYLGLGTEHNLAHLHDDDDGFCAPCDDGCAFCGGDAIYVHVWNDAVCHQLQLWCLGNLAGHIDL